MPGRPSETLSARLPENRYGCWPISSALRSPAGRSPMSAWPSFAASQPPATLSSVDLPDPDGPVTATTLRGGTNRLTPRSAGSGRLGNRTVTSRSVTSGADRDAAPGPAAPAASGADGTGDGGAGTA